MKTNYKFWTIKVLLWVLLIPYFYYFSEFCANLGLADLWGDMFDTETISNFYQWISLITYRFFIYFFPAIFLMFIRFDDKHTMKNRYLIWQSQVFCIYLVVYALIRVLALNMVPSFRLGKAFDTLTFVVSFAGYLFTTIYQKKINFDSTASLLGEKPYSNSKNVFIAQVGRPISIVHHKKQARRHRKIAKKELGY